MDIYIYYSIILFSSFIILLYIYLLYEKFLGIYNNNRTNSYKEKIVLFMDNLLLDLDNRDFEEKEIIFIRSAIKNRIKRKLIIGRIIKYNEIYSGSITKKLINLCEVTGLVESEIKNLRKKDKYKLALCCKNLGEFRSSMAIEPLIEVIKEDSIDVRYHIFLALAKIGQYESFIKAFNQLDSNDIFSERGLTEIIDSFEGDKRELYKTMINSENIYVSTVFIKSAGNYMDIALNEDIYKFVDDENKNRSIAVIKALGQSVDVRYINKIIEKLRDKEWEVRAAAAKSLGRFENDKSLDSLIEALSDTEWWVRYNAANAIIKIRNGINRLENILLSKDDFAKDSIISAMEDSGVIQDVFLYEHLIDEDKRDILNMLKEYISRT